MTLSLSPAACRVRAHRLRELLGARGLDGALISARGHVHYFGGHWGGHNTAALLLIETEGPTTLVAPRAPDGGHGADRVDVYTFNRYGTLADDQMGRAAEALGSRLAKLKRLGFDHTMRPEWFRGEAVSILDDVYTLRRRKDEDEVAVIRTAIAATEAGYAAARVALKPGVTEVELFAEIQRAAALHLGEVFSEIGNDFRIGEIAGSPRRRPAEAGEIAVLDLTIPVRGYHSDLCRSFVVGAEPTPRQRQAHARVVEALDFVEATARPGSSCREVFLQAQAMLDGHEGWEFRHHLGHGVGLSPHEAPHLNPEWDDTLEIGDVIAVEPAAYGSELRAGIRLEQMYRLGEAGLEKLSGFGLEL